jgi:fatty-acyl-CoA synthase
MVDDAREFTSTLIEEIFFDDNWDEFLSGAETISDEKLLSFEEKVQFDDAVNIQYTSGTTGFPKGVTLSHHNILNNGYFIGIRINYSNKDSLYSCSFLSLFRDVIGNICCTVHGATMVIPNDSFDAKLTLEVVEKEKCTSLYGVPTMFIAELHEMDSKSYDQNL